MRLSSKGPANWSPACSSCSASEPAARSRFRTSRVSASGSPAFPSAAALWTARVLGLVGEEEEDAEEAEKEEAPLLLVPVLERHSSSNLSLVAAHRSGAGSSGRSECLSGRLHPATKTGVIQLKSKKEKGLGRTPATVVTGPDG